MRPVESTSPVRWKGETENSRRVGIPPLSPGRHDCIIRIGRLTNPVRSSMKNFRQYAKAFILVAIVVFVLYEMESRDDDASGALTPAVQRKTVDDISTRDLNGHSWRLSDHRGEVVLLNFWATWCPPCREETPDLVRLAKSYPENKLDIVGVSMDEGRPAAVRQFVAAYKIPYVVSMAGDDFPLASGLQGIPTTLLIDREGRIAKKYVGATSERAFRADVDALLREPAVDPSGSRPR